MEGFEAIAQDGIKHFQKIFKDDGHANLENIIKIVCLFPSTITEEDNHALMEDISLEELKIILSLLKNDRSLGPDGFPIEFYIGLFNVLAHDLLKVIKETKQFNGI